VINLSGIKKDEIPWGAGESLIARYDKTKGLLVMKPESDIEIC